VAITEPGGGTLLPSFQSLLNEALKAEGLIPMTTGITRPVAPATDYSAVLKDAGEAVDRASVQFGQRAIDRYSTGVGSSYRDQRFAIIASLENIRTTSYDDSGNRAVGLGFNMDKPGARDVWNMAFAGTVDFDAVHSGTKAITPAQAKQLFDHDVVYFERVVDKVAGNRPLTQNQRLALVSVAYTTPSRVEKWAPIVQSGDDAAVADLILTQSFRPDHPQADGLKKRRYIEASLYTGTMEASSLIPTFDEYMEAVQVDPKTGNASVNGIPVVEGRQTLVSFPTDVSQRPALAIPIPLSERTITGSAEAYARSNEVSLSALEYGYSPATKRDLPVKEELVRQVQQSVTAVYGADYRATVISGTQNPNKATASDSGRHDHGAAADIYVYAPDGTKLSPDQLVPLAQHWVGSKIGSVGFPANGQSMHLDLVGGEGPGSVPLGPGQGKVWYYGTPSSAQRSSLNLGLSGKLPNYVLDPKVVAAGLVPPESLPTVATQVDLTNPNAMPTKLPLDMKANRMLDATAPKGKAPIADRVNGMLDATAKPQLAQVVVARRPVPFSMPTPRPTPIVRAAAQVGGGQGGIRIDGVGTFGVSGATPRSVSPERGVLPTGQVVTKQQTKVYNPDTNVFEERTVWR